ncbi:hypothetical protein GQX74_010635 [Glossina fuscipes]|nr:hypothetical protein GQX74_010635 [Glossina fuscipes]
MSPHKRCGEQVSNLATPTPADNKIKLQGQTYRRDGQPVCKPDHEFVARQSETLTSHDIAAAELATSHQPPATSHQPPVPLNSPTNRNPSKRIISSEDYQLLKPWDVDRLNKKLTQKFQHSKTAQPVDVLRVYLRSCGQHDSFAIMWSAMLLGLVDSTVVYLLYLSQPIDVVSRGFYSNRSKYLYRDADAVNVNEQQTPLDKVIQTAVPAIAIDDLEDCGTEKNSTANSAKCIMRCGRSYMLTIR